MGSETEPAKALLPYLQRADELQKHEPLVAYYCRLYAMDKGLKIPVKERTKTTNSILVSLMNQLEKDKKSLKLGSEDNLYVEGFASNVFAKADKQDRAGRADLYLISCLICSSSIRESCSWQVMYYCCYRNTAKTFYAASIFFEILYQFGELQSDIEQKQKYAAWKAADIRKALKEGRKPEPGPPGGDKDLSIPSTMSANEFDVGQSESFPVKPTVVDASHPGDNINVQHPENLPPSPSSYRSPTLPSNDIHQSPASLRTESSIYSQPYHDQSYSSEQQPTHQPYHDQSYSSEDQPTHQPSHDQSYSSEQQPIHQNYPPEGHHAPSYPSQDKPVQSYSFNGLPPNYPTYNSSSAHGYPSHDSSLEKYPSHDNTPQRYPSHEASSASSYTYPNFQTYPSFNDSTLPTTPTHHPSYYHGSDTAQPYQSAPASGYPSAMQYDPTKRNGTHTTAPSVSATANYSYDSSYQPPVEKIAEAHKAARFAVGALAFDDVPVAVEFLRRSLELLTNPSAESH